MLAVDRCAGVRQLFLVKMRGNSGTSCRSRWAHRWVQLQSKHRRKTDPRGCTPFQVEPREGALSTSTISDGTRIMDLHLVEGNPHAAGMLMVHLPKEQILIEADLFTPPAVNAPYPVKPSAATMSLYNNVQRLKLRVDRIVPLHGRVVPWSELAAFAAKGGTR